MLDSGSFLCLHYIVSEGQLTIECCILCVAGLMSHVREINMLFKPGYQKDVNITVKCLLFHLYPFIYPEQKEMWYCFEICIEMSFGMKRICTDLVSGNNKPKKTPTHADSCITFCSNLANMWPTLTTIKGNRGDLTLAILKSSLIHNCVCIEHSYIIAKHKSSKWR